MARRDRESSSAAIRSPASETCQNCNAVRYLREARSISKNALPSEKRIVEERRSTRRRSMSKDFDAECISARDPEWSIDCVRTGRENSVSLIIIDVAFHCRPSRI